jgi:MurNAc alpha-1-phosphate uridylyltransferase
VTDVRIAMVLAAGLGTRMRPLTDTVPKPLVQLAGQPLLDHVLDKLAEARVRKAVVNVHYMADQIESHLARRATPQIVISDERELLLDTGGGAAHALAELGDGPFFIHNSDSVWIEGPSPCLERMAQVWDSRAMDTLLLLAPVVGTLGYEGRGDFHMDANAKIYRSGEGQLDPYVFTGVSIADARLFEDCPEEPFSLNVLWDRSIALGRAFGLRHEGVWMHIGTPQALEEAEERLRLESG